MTAGNNANTMLKFNITIGSYLDLMGEMIKCICGKCNELIPKIDKYGKERQWKKGHWNKLKDMRGEKSSSWRGGNYKISIGYILIYNPTHPNCNNDGYVYEHRLIMEKHLGRYLTKQEVVHHINGIKDDNRPENLELFDCNGNHLRDEFETHHYNTKDMSNRFCLDCNGNKTYNRKWHKSHTGFLCSKCYAKKYHRGELI